MKRTKLADRVLPVYSRGEEIMNMVTHIVGGALGILALALCLLRSVLHANPAGILTSVIYGLCMVALYTVSSVYHGLYPCTGKKVLQVIDHCTIYFLIAGTYTPIVVCAIAPVYPEIGWGLLVLEWSLAVLAAVFTAIDLKNYRVFSMACYIGMGWGIIFFLPQFMQAVPLPCFLLILSGGIAYTVGAVLYGLGKRVPWMHSVFHIFVVLGSLLQFLAIFLYVV